MAIVSFKNTILKNLFSKPYTRKTEKEFPEGTRGHVENDMDLCILCGLCSIKCPTHAITVDKVEKTWNIRCCVDSCTKKSLSMGTRFQEPGSEKVVKSFKQSEKAIAAQEALMKAAKERAAAAAKAKAEKDAQDKAAQEKENK